MGNTLIESIQSKKGPGSVRIWIHSVVQILEFNDKHSTRHYIGLTTSIHAQEQEMNEEAASN